MTRFRDDKGFTLVEIMIVLAIIALMVGLSGIGISYLISTDVEGKAEKLASQIRDTRNIQIERSKEKFYLVFEIDADNTVILKQMREGLSEPISVNKISDKFSFSHDGAVIIDGEEIRFSNYSGKAISGSGVYRISNGSKTMKITIQEQNGKVIVEEE